MCARYPQKISNVVVNGDTSTVEPNDIVVTTGTASDHYHENGITFKFRKKKLCKILIGDFPSLNEIKACFKNKNDNDGLNIFIWYLY